MTIEYSPKFCRWYKELPKDIKILAEKQERIFRKSPFDPRLKTHKLSVPLRRYWAFSVGRDYRIIFSFVDYQKVRFHLVGDHKVYKISI